VKYLDTFLLSIGNLKREHAILPVLYANVLPITGPSNLITGLTTSAHGITMRSYSLDKLTVLNYLAWTIHMTLMLKQGSLWDIVSGTTQSRSTNTAE
jgi:hypothetical protein